MPNEEKASILRNKRDKIKPMPPFTKKSNKSKIGVLIHQHLKLEEDACSEDDASPTNYTEEDTFILPNSTTAKNDRLANLHSILFSNCKKMPKSNAKVNKASVFEKR